MLRYLLKTLLQLNLFADSLGAESSNSSDPNGSHPLLEDTAPRIVQHPTDLLVPRGDPATLHCRAEGRPAPAVEWYKDGERVGTGREDPRSHRTLLPGGSLYLPRILPGRRGRTDEGVYVCVARNYLGVATSRNASLELAVLRDDFQQPPGDVEVASGDLAVLECVPPRGHPKPSITWKKDGAWLGDGDERLTIRGGKLMVAPARKSDTGLYVCVATNAAGERDSAPARLLVLERPAFDQRPQDQAVLVGGTAEFTCQAGGDPRPAVRWYKEEGTMPAGRWDVLPDNTLQLWALRPEDEGTYTCVADNGVGRAQASATLTVRVPPQLVTGPRNQSVTPGQSVTFPCHTRGNPPPAIFWQKEGTQTLLFPGQPPSPSARHWVSPAGSLTIVNVTRADAGSYLCQALSVAGSLLAQASLQVAQGEFLPHPSPPTLPAPLAPTQHPEIPGSSPHPPVIRRGPGNRRVLPCRGAHGGDPPTSRGGQKDGNALGGAQPHISLLENSTLRISGLKVVELGHYNCVATSPVGKMSWGDSLEVQGNGSDISPLSPEAGVLPGPPSTPVVTNITESSVTLSWKGNEDSGATNVTSYIVEAFSQAAGGPWQTVAADVEGETHTVSGLIPDTIYLFLVRAANAHGLSDPSGLSEPVRTQAATTPVQAGLDLEKVQQELAQVTVHLLEPVVLLPGTVRLFWTVEHQAPFLEGYRVLLRRGGGRWEEARVARGDRGVLLTHLHRGQNYQVKVQPYFHHFHGPDSAVRTLSIPEAVPSAPPQAVSVAGNGTSVRISWQPPPPAEQNGIIRDYRIWCLGNESRFHINQSVEGTVLVTVLQGLIPGVPYHAQVAAATSAGVGTRSAPIPILVVPPVEQDVGLAGGSSVAQRLAEVARRPAFIAGVGSAGWLILAALAMWLYSRRRRKKELSHFTASFAYTPAGEPRGSAGTRCCPSPPPLSAITFPTPACGSPRTVAGGYPWLADAWRSGVASSLGTTDRYYNDAGITRYIAQMEPFGAGAGEGLVYGTLEVADEELSTLPRPFSQHGTPYPGGGPQPMDAPAPHRRVEHGAKGTKLGKTVKPPVVTWTEVKPPAVSWMEVKPPVVSWTELLPPPPSDSELSHCAQEEDEEEEAARGLGTEEWCPGEDIPCATATPSPAASSRSMATLTPSAHTTEDTSCLHDFQSSRLPWSPPRSAGTSNQDTVETPPPRARCPLGTGTTRGDTPKSRLKPKCSRYRQEKPPGELPPPPVPPPGQTPGALPEPSRAQHQATPDELILYGKTSGQPWGQASGGGSTAGSISSRGSTSSRGHGSGCSRTTGDRSHRHRPGLPATCPTQDK